MHPTTEEIELEDFDQNDIDSLLATKSAIIRSGKFKIDTAKCEVWMEWFDSTLPTSSSAKEYAISHEYSQPLNAYLSDTILYTIPKQYLADCKDLHLINKVSSLILLIILHRFNLNV